MSKKEFFLHQPPMKKDIALEEEQIDIDKLSNLLSDFSKVDDIEKIKDKSIILDIYNEDIQIAKQKKIIEEKYKRIKSDFGGSIPNVTELTNQNDELRYMRDNIEGNNFLKRYGNLLEKKKLEVEKLKDLWNKICKQTPQLTNCKVDIDLDDMLTLDIENLMIKLNSIIDDITRKMSNH